MAMVVTLRVFRRRRVRNQSAIMVLSVLINYRSRCDVEMSLHISDW